MLLLILLLPFLKLACLGHSLIVSFSCTRKPDFYYVISPLYQKLLFTQFIHSFRPFLQRLFKATTRPTQRRSRHITDIVPEFHAEAPQAIVSNEIAQGSYMYIYVPARAGVEPKILRTKGVDSTNAPHTLPNYVE